MYTRDGNKFTSNNKETLFYERDGAIELTSEITDTKLHALIDYLESKDCKATKLKIDLRSSLSLESCLLSAIQKNKSLNSLVLHNLRLWNSLEGFCTLLKSNTTLSNIRVYASISENEALILKLLPLAKALNQSKCNTLSLHYIPESQVHEIYKLTHNSYNVKVYRDKSNVFMDYEWSKSHMRSIVREVCYSKVGLVCGIPLLLAGGLVIATSLSLTVGVGVALFIGVIALANIMLKDLATECTLTKI